MSKKTKDTTYDEWDNKVDTRMTVALWVLGTLTVLYFGGHFAFWLITN